jgi:DNA-binding NarL/FixJ family response regulator
MDLRYRAVVFDLYGTLIDQPHHLRTVKESRSVSAQSKITAVKREGMLVLVARGLVSMQIAAGYCCSQRTVETHRCRIVAKRGFGNRTDMIRYAGERKFVP